jgi:hypothetical protein
MINWKRCVYGDKVRLVDIDGEIFDGIVEHIVALEDRSDLENPEDGLDIILPDGRHIGFYESEIKSVSKRFDDIEDVNIIHHASIARQAV